MTPQARLGRLESVDLRQSWPHEADDFTPWLALEENLGLLGEVLGLELELIETEQDVGPYRADIVCKNTADGSWVLVENQLARTDHTHLGQLLTYAAGLSAVHVVWIAKRFTDEHRAALDWLNENTNENLRFFGLEIELWRIGESPPAPKFNVVSSPNDWVKGATRRVVGVGEVTPTKALQQEFWMYFADYCEGRGFRFSPTKARPEHWMTMALGRSAFSIRAIASRWNSADSTYQTWELRAEFAMYDGAHSFETLKAESEKLHQELGFPLTWSWPEGAKEAKATCRQTTDLFDRGQWESSAAWLADHLDAMHRVLGPRVKALP